VLAATVTSAVGRQGVGDIRLERLRGMAVADGHELSGRVVAALNQAALNAALLANADAIKWSKMLTNLPGNATAAILNMTPGEVYRHPGLLRLELAQLRETLAVMRALSIPVVDLPGTPVRMLAFAARSLPPLIAQPLLQRAIGKGRGEKMPSFLIDLRSGRGQSEVEYLNGAVARIGERAGVDARVNARLSEILMALARGELPVAAYDHRPDALIREIGLKKNRSGQTEER
jgi:2-dehydropantoate 2-reductase